MIESATGLILRLRPLTETSLIVQWLTPDLGRIATVAKGARRPKSAFRGKLDLFYLAGFSFARSRRSELHTLHEVSLLETHARLRHDIGFLQQASYAAALVEQTTESETPMAAVFELMRGFLGALVLASPSSKLVVAFELKLLTELGLQPDVTALKLTGGARAITRTLAEADWNQLRRLHLSATQATELRQFLHGYLVYHLGKIPSARAAAFQV